MLISCNNPIDNATSINMNNYNDCNNKNSYYCMFYGITYSIKSNNPKHLKNQYSTSNSKAIPIMKVPIYNWIEMFHLHLLIWYAFNSVIMFSLVLDWLKYLTSMGMESETLFPQCSFPEYKTLLFQYNVPSTKNL